MLFEAVRMGRQKCDATLEESQVDHFSALLRVFQLPSSTRSERRASYELISRSSR
jgi:hypothetical protein